MLARFFQPASTIGPTQREPWGTHNALACLRRQRRRFELPRDATRADDLSPVGRGRVLVALTAGNGECGSTPSSPHGRWIGPCGESAPAFANTCYDITMSMRDALASALLRADSTHAANVITPTGRAGLIESNAGRSAPTGPAVKTSNPASRLVAQEAPLVAFGLGLRIPAAGPATYRQYSYCGVCERRSQSSSQLR